MPTLAQTAAMSGTSLSGRVSKPETLVNQAKGQLQEYAYTVAEERAPVLPEVLTEEAAYAGAGAGPAERAPIQVAPPRDTPAQWPSASPRGV